VRNHAAYVFWMVEEADVMVLLQDKPKYSLEMLDQLSDRRPCKYIVFC